MEGHKQSSKISLTLCYYTARNPPPIGAMCFSFSHPPLPVHGAVGEAFCGFRGAWQLRDPEGHTLLPEGTGRPHRQSTDSSLLQSVVCTGTLRTRTTRHTRVLPQPLVETHHICWSSDCGAYSSSAALGPVSPNWKRKQRDRPSGQGPGHSTHPGVQSELLSLLSSEDTRRKVQDSPAGGPS